MDARPVAITSMAGIGSFRKLTTSFFRSLGLRSIGLQNDSSTSPVESDSTPIEDPGMRLRSSAGGAPSLKHGLEPRRYKRALLLTDGAGIQTEIASASVLYRGKPFAVVDLSHSAVAIQRGGITDVDLPNALKPEPMVLNCGLLSPFSVQVVLARHSEHVLAFEFADVSTEGRLTIDRFLDPKMIGLNMRAVDRAFFSPGETFSYWYCGPRDTNFFLWMSGGRLDRAIIQLGDDQFTLAPASGRGGGVRCVRHNAPTLGVPGPTVELRDSVLFALDVALQVRDGGDAILGLVKLLTEAADTLQSGT